MKIQKLIRIFLNRFLLLNFLVLIVFVFISWQKNQCNGYDDINKLCKNFVIKLKSSNKELEEYCYDINPDSCSVEYMKKLNYSYRGIPDGLIKHNIDVNLLGKDYYEKILKFKQELIIDKKLDDLEFIRRSSGEIFARLPRNIEATSGRIWMKSGNDTIHFNLGEMLKINGKWKTFTEPSDR